jgi:predicted alpha/beta-fold hydrolase
MSDASSPEWEECLYKPPFWAKSRTLNTIYASQFRKVRLREEPQVLCVKTADGDELWVDYYARDDERAPVVVLSHGLEGHSRETYVLGMVKALRELGFAVLAWNYRGCGDRENLLPRFYHAGVTDDLHQVVIEAALRHPAVFLVGFSLGGNITANYLGSYLGRPPHNQVQGGAVASVPFDMLDSGLVLHRRQNWFYEKRFLKKLLTKVEKKRSSFPELPGQDELEGIKSLEEFDDRITAPLHGFANARDYWARTSSKYVLPQITLPLLIIQAQDDPFFGPGNQPSHLDFSPSTQWLNPPYGGHLGFIEKKGRKTFPERIIPGYFKFLSHGLRFRQ